MEWVSDQLLGVQGEVSKAPETEKGAQIQGGNLRPHVPISGASLSPETDGLAKRPLFPHLSNGSSSQKEQGGAEGSRRAPHRRCLATPTRQPCLLTPPSAPAPHTRPSPASLLSKPAARPSEASPDPQACCCCCPHLLGSATRPQPPLSSPGRASPSARGSALRPETTSAAKHQPGPLSHQWCWVVGERPGSLGPLRDVTCDVCV